MIVFLFEGFLISIGGVEKSAAREIVIALE